MQDEAYRRASRLVKDYHDHVPHFPLRYPYTFQPSELNEILKNNRPCVIEGLPGGLSVPFNTPEEVRQAQGEDKFWSKKGLIDILGDEEVSIAVDPLGLADSIQSDETGQKYFTQPLTEKMTMSRFLDKIADSNDLDVCYLQSQNGNIWNTADEDETPELHMLQSRVTHGIELMAGMGRIPEASNLWIGAKQSVTTLHKDPYDNLYQVLSGSKTFTVLNPVEGFLLNPTFYPTATYTRDSDGKLIVKPDETEYKVPWTTVDPTQLPANSPLRPITLVVNEGEWLFLPAHWWHHVQQDVGEEGICVAVNHWYEAPFRADVYAMEQFIWASLGRADLTHESEDSDSESSSG